MHEIDKKTFAAFLTQLRKEQGMTQKELAEKLFVSDKAVSKWERGLSMPDISLLIPLAETLGVTVTELLEGRRLESKELATEQVEEIVQKALRLSEEPVKPNPKKAWPMVLAICIAALELLLKWHFFADMTIGSGYKVLWGMSLGFGIYFWFLLPEQLPSYYDEHEISSYSDGFLRLNLPGVAFNNTNWPRIVNVLRMWGMISLVSVLPAGILLGRIPMPDLAALMVQMGCLLLYLGSLFVPIYLCARKTGKRMGKEKMKFLITLVVLLCLLSFSSHGSIRSGTRIGYFETSTSQSWSASYVSFDGWMQRNLKPQLTSYLLQVTTQEGALSIDISDENGLVFSETNIPTGSYTLELDGKVKIKVSGEGHRGSFSIAPG